MGGGLYSDDAVAARVAMRSTIGKATVASYTADVVAGKAPKKAHNDLDPFGLKVRESRDSEDHPRSKPVVLVLDGTGSMGGVINAIQKSLKPLMGLLIRKGYLPDPQICLIAIGDEFNHEAAPLQVSQFESDARIEGNLDNILIERGGGATMQESYQNAAYVIARKTATDAWDLRGEKGYCFIFGDETNYAVSRETIKKLIGDDLQNDISTEAIYAEMRERWNVFFVLPKHASNGGNKAVKDHWSPLVGGQNVLELEDENAAAECVAVQIGICEGTTDVDRASKDIRDVHGDNSKSTALIRSVMASVNTTHGGQTITKVASGTLMVSSGAPAIERT